MALKLFLKKYNNFLNINNKLKPSTGRSVRKAFWLVFD